MLKLRYFRVIFITFLLSGISRCQNNNQQVPQMQAVPQVVPVDQLQQVPVQQQQQQQVPMQQQQQVPVQQQQQVPMQQQQQVPVQQQQVPMQQQQQQQQVPMQQQQVPVQQQQQVPVQQQQQVPVQQQQVPMQQQQQVPMQQQQQQVPVQQQQVPQQQVPVQQQQRQPPPPPPPQQQVVPPPPPPAQQQGQQRPSLPPPPPPMRKKVPIRVEQKPIGKNVDLEAIRMPSRERFKFDMAPEKSYVYFTSVISTGARDCYFYNPIASFNVFTQVISGGNFDISLAVVDPEGKLIVQREASKEEEVKITVNEEDRDRAYAVCLDNRKASAGEKVVYISIDLNIDFDNPSDYEKQILDSMRSYYNNTQAESQDAKLMQENAEALNSALDSISSRIRKINMLTAKTRNIHTIDRITLTKNHEKISSWSLFQVVVMFLVALVQTAVIRNLFEGGRVSLWRSLFTPSSAANGKIMSARA